MTKKDPYKILGIKSYATTAEINKAFRALALKYHPDKNTHATEEAEQQFKEILEAYETLTGKNSSTPFEQSFHDVGEGDIVPYEEGLVQIEEEPAQIEDGRVYAEIEGIVTGAQIKNSQAPDWSDCFNKKVYDDSDFWKKKLQPEYTEKNISFTEPFDSFTEEQIAEKMEQAWEKYKDIPEKITDKAFLWIAEKSGCAPIYIYSSIHHTTFDKEDIFGDAIDNVLDKVDEVFTEVPAYIPKNLSLSNIFSFLKSEPGLVKNLKFEEMPAIKNPFKKIGDDKADDKTTSMDGFIAQKAYARNKTVRFLENARVRKVAYGENTPGAGSYIDIPEKELQQFCENHLTHVSPSRSELNDPSDESKLGTIKRHMFWMESVLENSCEKQKASLLVDGAVHNAGKYGIPNLLASEGYTVSPLMKTPPVPKSTQIRDAFIGHGPGFFNYKPVEKSAEPVQEAETIPVDLLRSNK